MSMSIDDFTNNCIMRVNKPSIVVTIQKEKPEDKGGEVTGIDAVSAFPFMSLLAPFISAAIEYLVDRLGSCGRSDEDVLSAVNSGSFAARYIVNRAVYLASDESEIPRSRRGQAKAIVKKTILAEAKDTKDEDLVSMLREGDSYNFDATDIWG